MLDNEAQLAYVLGHELAHVYKNHSKTKTIMKMAEPEYNERQMRKAALWAAALGGVGAAIGAVTKDSYPFEIVCSAKV